MDPHSVQQTQVVSQDLHPICGDGAEPHRAIYRKAEGALNLTTAFNIFVRQSLREGGIPFEGRLEQPNKETVAAMLEAERIAKDPSVKGYNDLDELFADLKR